MQYQNNRQMYMINNRFPIFKALWLFIRLIINSTIFVSIFYEPGFTDELCGPLAIPANHNLIERVLIVELTNFFWPLLLVFSLYLSNQNYKWRKMVELRWPKMLFILILKLTIILSQTQRLKYYMHVFII